MFKNWKANNAKRANFSGETIQIPKSKWGYLRDLKLYGKSVQKQTVQGKNLFDKNRAFSGTELLADGSTAVNALYAATDYIKVTYGLNYRISGRSATRMCFYRLNKTFLSEQTGSQSFTPPADCEFVRFNMDVGHLETCQLELGSTATAYEPFTPNSPSPDYPSQINNVPSAFDLTSCGKNLSAWNSLAFASGTSRTFWEGNFTGRMTLSFKILYTSYSGSHGSYFIEILYSDGTQTLISPSSHFPNIDTEYSRATTTDAGKTVTLIRLVNNPKLVGNIWDIQIEKNETATPYTPYLGTTTPLSLIGTSEAGEWAGKEIELGSLPDGTKDEYDQDRNIVIKRVKELIITSGSLANYYNITANPDLCQIAFQDISNRFATTQWNTPDIMSNIGKSGGSHRPNKIWIDKTTTQTTMVILQNKADLDSADTAGARKWINNQIAAHGNIVFQYPLAMPIEIPVLPQPKIQTVKDEVGYIYTNAEVQPEISANAISYGG